MTAQSLLEPHSVLLSDDANFFPATDVNRNFPQLLRPLDHSGPTLVHRLVQSKMERVPALCPHLGEVPGPTQLHTHLLLKTQDDHESKCGSRNSCIGVTRHAFTSSCCYNLTYGLSMSEHGAHNMHLTSSPMTIRHTKAHIIPGARWCERCAELLLE